MAPKQETARMRDKRLQTENADLLRQKQELEEQLAAVKSKAGKVDAPTVLDDEPEPIGREPEVLRDPFESQHPHKFIAEPPGFKLGWKNPRFRETDRNWKGWEAVQLDDFIGKNLHLYLLDPPHRMEHPTDNIVRRGDVVLCYLPIELWNARQQQRADKANRLYRKHAENMTQDYPVAGKFQAPKPTSGKHIGGSRMPSPKGDGG